MKTKPQSIGIVAMLIVLAVCADGSIVPTAKRGPAYKSPRAAGEMMNAPMLLGATSLTPSQRIVTVSVPKTRAVNLAWNPSSDVAGYNVFSGGRSRSYTNSLAVGNVVAASVPNLLKGSTYYFAVTAYDAFGYESQFSSEVSYTVPFYDLFGVSVTFLKSDKSTGPWTSVTTFPEITVANTNLTEFYSSKMDIWVK